MKSTSCLRYRKLILLTLLSFGALGAFSSAADAPDDLAAGFTSPPDSTRPTVFWHWIDDNVSKEGITADLEEMKRVGIGGVLLVWAHARTPPGTVLFQSPDWYNMVQFALQESHRLGLTMEIAPGEGWAAGGGKWIDPAHSMLRVTSSEIHVKGPTHFNDVVPMPPALLKFYRDIKVLAYPTPPADAVTMAQASPTITSSDPGFDGQKVIDGDPKTTASLPLPTPGHPQYIQFEFTQPYQVRNLSITGQGNGLYQAEGQLQSSSDGQKFSNIRGFRIDRGDDPQSWSTKATLARFYRIEFTKPPVGYNGNPAPANLTFAEVGLQPTLVVDGLEQKLDVIRNISTSSGLHTPATPDFDLAIDPSKIVDISSNMDATGRVTWDVPAGDWTILRLGYTSTGSVNNPSGPDAKGLESDKLSAEATDILWNGLTKKIMDLAGPLTGQTLTASWVDSWEAGSQNWTPALQDEFKKRRGYDMTPYLPIFAGHVIESPEKTERFMWDLRRTIADLCSENFFSELARLAHQSGMKFTTEPYGSGPFEDLSVAKDADVIRGEFWPSHTLDYENSPRLAASISHVYGKRVIGTESFTDIEGRWQNSPEKLKPLGDIMYTLGINQFTLHEYSHTPWLNVVPGMALSQFGSNLNRGVTWAEQSVAWNRYMARCHFLLQQGMCVADFLYFNGENVPAVGGPLPLVMGRRSGDMAPPPGYEYDDCAEDVIIHRLSVKDGRLVLPDGMSYRALILPDSDTMTPELLEKLKQLAEAGATIIGPKPEYSPSLTNYPECDADLKKMADELWGANKIADHKSMSEIIPLLGLKPDFEFKDKAARLFYTHRLDHGTDIYFLSNQNGDYEDTDCFFRLQGKVPELWYPDTGKMEPVTVYSEEDGRIRIPLHFEPSGAFFVVFRDAAAGASDHAVSLVHTDAAPPSKSTLQITKAIYGSSGTGGSVDVTGIVQSLVRGGSLSLTVDPNLFGRDPAQRQQKQLKLDYVYNGTPGSSTVLERERMTIGDATPSVQFLDAKLSVAPDHSMQLEAWQPGTYEVKTAAGKDLQVVAAGLPASVTVSGPWQLSFPPNWGAPDKVTLDQLISWSDHPNDGVKYFSGTATYDKTLTVPAGMLGPGHHVYLDLGAVKVLADVIVNGRDLGILWKTPFCVEVTDAVKAGDNALEVKVTNLWPNRIIGDEHLPPDREWSGNGLKAWPDWLLQGKPSPTGRFTFENWHQWTQGAALLTSGLLGPVKLIPSVDAKVSL